MIVIYDLVLGAILLLVIAVLIWYISNVIRYLALRSGSEKGGFFSMADKWLDAEQRKKEGSNGKAKKSNKPAKKGGNKNG